VELCGRTINVGRPKGYIDPAFSSMSGAGFAAQPTGFAGFGAAAVSGTTRVLLLTEYMLTEYMLTEYAH
jgi:hypothetical protein